MFSTRYARALLQQRAKQLGSTRALSRQLNMPYQMCRRALYGREGPNSNPRNSWIGVGSKAEAFLHIKPVLIYVPVGMSDQEIDARLSLARRGNLG